MELWNHLSPASRPGQLSPRNSSKSLHDNGDELSVLRQLKALNLENLDTLKDVFVTGLKGEPVNDKDYLMERVIKIVSELPVSSSSSEKLTTGFLSLLWNDLQHPPSSYLGEDYIYRKANGSNNNIRWPHIGEAGAPYARTVKPEIVTPIARPDPGVIFDSVLKRDKFVEHPNRISSVLFYLASIIIHDIFHTSHTDFSKSQTSSYLDLAPLYGSSQEQQDQMRTFLTGKLKPDTFSDERILGFPPGVGLLLIFFNRFHNWIVEQLALIDENGRFSSILQKHPAADGVALYDNALFQTGRLITGGLYINIILKDYVRTILNLNRTMSPWDLDPRSETGKSVFGDIPMATGNQVSAEFNLVYRWHSCVSERDDKWSQDMYAQISGGAKPESLNDFLHQISKWASRLPADPQKRPFADLERMPGGSFKDDDLAAILTASVEDCAGAFGAKHVPEILRDVDILGIIQARSWNLASLNEFRKYFNLEPHKTFEDINSDPDVADALRHLYEHPDFVEIYPGIVVESAKEPVLPGSGLCTNFTISRAVLSDAVALVRGDRFYTVDYNSKNLTNFGFEAANYDLAVDNGCVFHKLVLRALPHHYSYDSVYAHFPMVVPAENKKIMTSLGLLESYSFGTMSSRSKGIRITSYEACYTILQESTSFKTAGPSGIASASYSSSGPSMSSSIYLDHWQRQVASFYEQITLDLLHRRSFAVASVNYIDIVKDFAQPAQLQFAASIFSLPLRSDQNEKGAYSEKELHDIMASISESVSAHGDSISMCTLREKLKKYTPELEACLQSTVDGISKISLTAGLVGRLQKHDTLTDYGIQVIHRLLKSDLGKDEVVKAHLLPAASVLVTQLGKAFVECLNFYLSEAGSVHLSDIQQLSLQDTPAATNKLKAYALEGSRLGCSLCPAMTCTTAQIVEDHDQTMKLAEGQEVYCDLRSAYQDPDVFPNPTEVNLARDETLYSLYGFGPYGYLDAMSTVALTTMLKTVGKLKNLRRAPGPEGQLKSVPGPHGGLLYMDAEQTKYTPFPSAMKLCWGGPLPPARK